MTGEPDLISLLYRADWTRLCLSAEVNDGTTVLIAPGRRYRLQTGEYVRGCDGDRPWESDPDDVDGNVRLVGGPEAPLREMLCPSWLLTSSELEVVGHVTACGRDALQVVVTRRPGMRGRIAPVRLGPGRVEAIVDAELGILLRIARMAGSEAHRVTELVSLDLSPVIDPAQFTPPPGSVIGESIGQALHAGGPVWWAVKSAAGLAAGGLGAFIRYSPFSHRQPTEAGQYVEAAIPPDDPAPELSLDGLPSGPQIGNDVLHLLHDSGTGEFAATLHQWNDFGAMLARVPPAARRTGFGGLGLLVDAVSERPSAFRLVSALRIGGPDRYQIDHAYEPTRGPKTIACDGQRRWEVFADKVTVGPAKPLPHHIADLADVSWLLECRLSGGALVMAGDRPGIPHQCGTR